MNTNVKDHMVFSYGYVARGQQALLKAQKDDMQLQKIEREQAQEALEWQYDAMKANARGVVAAADAEAKSDIWDAISYGTQAGTNALNVGHNIKNAQGMNKAVEEPQTRLNNAKAFEAKFNEAPGANGVISDEDLPPLNAQQQERMRQLKEGEDELRLQKGDDEILQHIRADDQARRALTKHINRTKETASRDINTAALQYQTKVQSTGLYYAVVQNTLQSASAGMKARYAKERGVAQATSVLAQTSQQNSDTAINSFMQHAETFDQQAAALNRAREALAGNGQG